MNNCLKCWLPWLLVCSLITSCGYQYGRNDGILAHYSTITVPYIEGDLDGSFTATVIKTISTSGAFKYQPSSASLTLKITQIGMQTDNIGFRYDRKKSGKLTKDTIPVEARIAFQVKVSVLNNATGCIILGPVLLSANVDYDHDFYFSRNGVNIFSLGQLSDLEEAHDAVQSSLYNVLAKKIVDYISQSW